jgi:hypothetical protein
MLLRDEINMNTKTELGALAPSGRLAFDEPKRSRLRGPLALLRPTLRAACELRRNFSHGHGGTILFQQRSPLDFADPGHRSLTTDLPMFTRGCIQAAIGQHQALNWLAADDVRLDDFIDVSLGDVSVPYGIGIDYEIRAVFALIETARLVGAHFALEAAFRQFLLE